MPAVDTMGGVRIPAAFCGIYGYRASHGVISTVGIIPVAPSLDVVGKWVYTFLCVNLLMSYLFFGHHSSIAIRRW
jgi:Asp-tRNA(Asn)/Glu-tRNA(Gln) amidotransferase A subunit family amidase